jgi:hypothetical protein
VEYYEDVFVLVMVALLDFLFCPESPYFHADEDDLGHLCVFCGHFLLVH